MPVERPTPLEQAEAWQGVLPWEGTRLPEGLPVRLAGQFNLNLPAINSIAERCLLENAPGDPGFDYAHAFWDTARVSTRPRMESLAQRIDVRGGWRDLVLPDAQRRQLYAITRQVRHRLEVYDEMGFRQRMNRGLGISVLFSGPSGTGKSMAAEVIAAHLCLDLYRIDLSAMVSKYIGETEKNLRRVFDTAESSGAILFFDEADALFGKRSEVKDSHDRYANIEVAYLLQRMESYAGLAILATNMKTTLDSAFLRRLRFIVNFPFPSPADRRRIWQRIFPPGVVRRDLDYDRLAQLDLAGGAILNVALNAAFLAAARGSQEVTMPLVLQAARDELVKLQKPFSETDLRWDPAAAEEAMAWR